MTTKAKGTGANKTTTDKGFELVRACNSLFSNNDNGMTMDEAIEEVVCSYDKLGEIMAALVYYCGDTYEQRATDLIYEMMMAYDD